MHSYLITGLNIERVEDEIIKLKNALGSSSFEFTLEKINDVRQLNSFSKLSVTRPTTILIRNIDNASTEALNAFLKNLEEPQSNLTFILTCSSISNVLPTIVSRCQVIRTGNHPKPKKQIVAKVKHFLKMPNQKKLLFINSIRDRNEALSFIKDVIFVVHLLLIKTDGQRYELVKTIKSAHLTFNNLAKNGNVGLQLTNFILSLA